MTVERGNVIYLVATFDGDPDGVFLTYIKPGEERPRVDPGFGQPGSQIERLSDGLYVAAVDTTGFHGGPLKWHLWGEGTFPGSAFGEVEIPDRPAQLL